MATKKKKLAELKTKPTAASVEDFINGVDSEQKREDSLRPHVRKIKESLAWSPDITASRCPVTRGFEMKPFTSAFSCAFKTSSSLLDEESISTLIPAIRPD